MHVFLRLVEFGSAGGGSREIVYKQNSSGVWGKDAVPDWPPETAWACCVELYYVMALFNRPFPNSNNSYFQKEAKCKTLAVKSEFYLHENK